MIVTKSELAILAADLNVAAETKSKADFIALARKASDILFRLCDQLPEDCSDDPDAPLEPMA